MADNISSVLPYVNATPGFQGFDPANLAEAQARAAAFQGGPAAAPVPNVPAPVQFDPWGHTPLSPRLPAPAGPPIQFAPGGVTLQQAQAQSQELVAPETPEQAAAKAGFGPGIPHPGTAPPAHQPLGAGHVRGPDDLAKLEGAFQTAADKEKAVIDENERNRLMLATRESDQIGQVSQERERQAAELRAKQDQIRTISSQLDEEDKRNLETAKNKTIPDFWAGHTGKLIGSAIAVALSGAGAALIGQTRNVAMEVIQHNIDRYMQTQKESIDNMYKYAEQRGRMNDQTRRRYATELLDLKDQHTYLLEAARDRVAQVQAEAKGAADKAQADMLKAGLDRQVIQERIGVRKLRGELALQAANTSKSYAEAEEARAKAKSYSEGYGVGGMKGQQFQLQVNNQIQRNLDKDIEARDLITSKGKYENALTSLKSGTGLGDKLTIDEITKAATGLGARPQSVKVFESATGSSFQKVLGALQQAQTGKPLTPVQSANVEKFLNYTIHESNRRLQGPVRDRLKAGMAGNPVYKQFPELIDAAIDQHFGQAGPQAATPQDQRGAAEQWARANPNDPRSKQILARLGLQ